MMFFLFQVYSIPENLKKRYYCPLKIGVIAGLQAEGTLCCDSRSDDIGAWAVVM